MSDEIRRLSDELARDPSSLVFLQLGEALRKTGQLDLSLKVCLRGLERHPHNPDAHDLLARVWLDRGEPQRAFDEWDMALRLAPTHAGARKGMGYVLFKEGRLDEAQRHLRVAAEASGDAAASAALHTVRQLLSEGKSANGDADTLAPADTPRRVEEEARVLFADILGDGEHTALLLDADGLVSAGAYVVSDGRDVAQEIGAALNDVRHEAHRLVRHLDLGAWRAVVYETDVATVAMAPAPEDSLVVVAAAESIPLGFVRRVLDRCALRASSWIRGER
jgi:tetratricopeptide (TPR) repeat protein